MKNVIKKYNSVIKIALCVMFGIAILASFIASAEWSRDFFGWFNLTRIAIYTLFLILLFSIFRNTPNVDSAIKNKKYQKWVKILLIALPILAVVLAMINAFLPDIGILVRTDDRNFWQRPAIIIKMLLQLIAGGFFISIIPRLIKQKKILPIVVVSMFVLILFVMAGEEISWGQRIFQWETTGYFADNNMQSETNLHNISTQLFQNVLYFGGFLLLIVLPFFREQLVKLLKKVKSLKFLVDFLPESWMMLAFGAGLMFVDPYTAEFGFYWGSICFQLIATIAFIVVLAHRLRDNKKHYDLALRVLACALIVVILSLSFDDLWQKNQGAPTEYLEMFISFGILCWAIGIRNTIKKPIRKIKSASS